MNEDDFADDAAQHAFVATKRAGAFIICGTTKLFVTQRPSWLARFFARWLLQWRWEDWK
jgi:hypothetical protein